MAYDGNLNVKIDFDEIKSSNTIENTVGKSDTPIAVLETNATANFTLTPEAYYEAPSDLTDIEGAYPKGDTYEWSYTPTYSTISGVAEKKRTGGTGQFKVNGTKDVKIKGTCSPIVYGFSAETLTNGVWMTEGEIKVPTSITHFETANLVASPNDGYDPPASITVEGAQSSYLAETGALSIINATKDVKIKAATCPLHEYKLKGNITNGSMPTVNLYYGQTASSTITPTLGYVLPTDVTVSGGNKKSYSSTTGVVEVVGTGADATVTATCPNAVYGVTYSPAYGTITPQRTTVTSFQTYSWTIKANTGYILPQTKGTDVKVEGTVSSWSYDKTTGELSISDPLSAIKISFTCAAQTWNVYDDITHGTVTKS